MMPGFMVYLYLHKNQVSVANPLICLYFSGHEMTKRSRTVQLIPQVLRDTSR